MLNLFYSGEYLLYKIFFYILVTRIKLKPILIP